jgi:hypothetical protein
MRPRFAGKFLTLEKEGAGNAGRSMRPQPGGQKKMPRQQSSPRSHRLHPAFPAQWFYGFLRALPGDQDLVDTVIGG